MWDLLRAFAAFVLDIPKSRAQLLAELAFLRQQLRAATRAKRRTEPDQVDRFLLVLLARFLPSWRELLEIVRPATLLRWHKDGWRAFWRAKSLRARPSGRKITEEIKAAIHLMKRENPRWGPKRIVGELKAKLGVCVHKRTVHRILRTMRRRPPGDQSWATFVRNHLDQIWACDLFTVQTWSYRTLHVFFVLKLGTREVLHWAVTELPSREWVTRQLREVMPFGCGPRFLIRDQDDKFGPSFDSVARACGTRVLKTPPGRPTANAYAERFVLSVRRELLDHVVVLHEEGLSCLLKQYVEHVNRSRPHQGIEQQIPAEVERPRKRPRRGRLVSRPILHGLIHEYEYASAA